MSWNGTVILMSSLVLCICVESLVVATFVGSPLGIQYTLQQQHDSSILQHFLYYSLCCFGVGRTHPPRARLHDTSVSLYRVHTPCLESITINEAHFPNTHTHESVVNDCLPQDDARPVVTHKSNNETWFEESGARLVRPPNSQRPS